MKHPATPYLLKLRRMALSSDYTDGILFDNEGYRLCDTLEPPSHTMRPGTKGCIPVGTYSLLVTRSPKFGRWLPLLMHVPGFTGIRIHPGNTVADTQGCILPGSRVAPGQLSESRPAMERLMRTIRAAESQDRPIFLQVVE